MARPELSAEPCHQWLVVGVTIVIVLLSYRPARNLLSRHQLMNTSFDPLHLVNTYGAFGSITKERYEVVIEGTDEPVLTPSTPWREYEFKAKPGDVRRRPPQYAPYHLRLDWLMWFAAMSSPMYHEWFVPLMVTLLEADPPTLRLLRSDPFAGARPEPFETKDERCPVAPRLIGVAPPLRGESPADLQHGTPEHRLGRVQPDEADEWRDAGHLDGPEAEALLLHPRDDAV